MDICFRTKPGLKSSVCENTVYPAGAEQSYVLNTKNGLPYLSKELFWMAMKDIAKKAKLISGHRWDELKEMLDNRTYEPQPQIYSVKTVEVPEAPSVVFTTTPRTHYFVPTDGEGISSIGSNISIQLQTRIEVGSQAMLHP